MLVKQHVYSKSRQTNTRFLGSNHGLFSLIAGSSGARTIAFEPQTHLQSKY